MAIAAMTIKPVKVTRLYSSASPDGTFSAAENNLAITLGEELAGYTKSNLYKKVDMTIEKKTRVTTNQGIGVQWRVTFRLWTYLDGMVHFEDA